MAHCDEALIRIAQAIFAYRDNNNGYNPPSLETLVETSAVSPWDLVCPASAFAVGQCSYVFCGGGLQGWVPGEIILAYDKTPCHKERRNVLFADGKVKRLSEKWFDKAIQKDNEIREQFELHRAAF